MERNILNNVNGEYFFWNYILNERNRFILKITAYIKKKKKCCVDIFFHLLRIVICVHKSNDETIHIGQQSVTLNGHSIVYSDFHPLLLKKKCPYGISTSTVYDCFCV